MRAADFEYDLPPELIAQAPAARRDRSRLLVLLRNSRQIEHRTFRDFVNYLQPRDLLVLNNSRVIPARLRGTNAGTGGQFEVLLLEETARNNWWVMLRPGKRARVGTRISFRDTQGNTTPIAATVIETNAEGHRRLLLSGTENILGSLDSLGEVPLPPYIERANANLATLDRERYQTVFAQPPGSVAAPTAGLHFTESLLAEIRARGVRLAFVTLHVGLGTFAPVKTESITAHIMHEERYELSEPTTRLIDETRREGGRVFAVGTTTLRVLETAALDASRSTLDAQRSKLRVPHSTGRTRLFVYPPYHFRVVDCLLTNFHLPRSTLLMLASAFAAPDETCGREIVLAAYAEAVRQRYRFFSYGDAMLLL
jgi:S-adenosylmethionine:tRNA ribosyltransferase-isomerase